MHVNGMHPHDNASFLIRCRSFDASSSPKQRGRRNSISIVSFPYPVSEELEKKLVQLTGIELGKKICEEKIFTDGALRTVKFIDLTGIHLSDISEKNQHLINEIKSMGIIDSGPENNSELGKSSVLLLPLPSSECAVLDNKINAITSPTGEDRIYLKIRTLR